MALKRRPHSATSASRAESASTSVRVRSVSCITTRNARLFLPAGRFWPWYRSNIVTSCTMAGFSASTASSRACAGDSGVHQQGDIAHHRRKAGGLRGPGQGRPGEDPGVQFEQHRRLWQFVLLLPARMQLAQPAGVLVTRGALDEHSRRTARMQRRVRRRLQAQPARRAHRLQVRLHVVEIHRARRARPTARPAPGRRPRRRRARAGAGRPPAAGRRPPPRRAGRRARSRTPEYVRFYGNDFFSEHQPEEPNRLVRMTDGLAGDRVEQPDRIAPRPRSPLPRRARRRRN